MAFSNRENFNTIERPGSQNKVKVTLTYIHFCDTKETCSSYFFFLWLKKVFSFFTGKDFEARSKSESWFSWIQANNIITSEKNIP